MHIWRENMNNKSNGQDFDRGRKRATRLAAA